MRPKLSYANVVSTLCLFLLLAGGAAFAAIHLPKNSVGTKQLKKNAVNSIKVKNRSLQAVDFKAGQLPAGPIGREGPKGDPGTPATKLFVSAREDGTLLHSSPGVTVGTYPGAGEYFATFPQDVTNCVAVGSLGEKSNFAVEPGEIITRTLGTSTPSHGDRVDILTTDNSGAKADRAFNLAVFC